MAKASRHVAPAKRPLITEDRLTVIIPAAGVGKRMKSKGPKALLPIVHGMPILEIQIRSIQTAYPKAEIIVVTGFECNKIRNFLWSTYEARMVYNANYMTTNVTHSVALGLDAAFPGNIIVIHGDLVFGPSAVNELAGEASSLLIDHHGDFDSEEVGIGTQGPNVVNLSYGLEQKWGQMGFFTGKELKLLRQTCFNYELSNQWFLYEAINHIIGRKGKFLAVQPKGKVIEIDKTEDIKRAKTVL